MNTKQLDEQAAKMVKEEDISWGCLEGILKSDPIPEDDLFSNKDEYIENPFYEHQKPDKVTSKIA